MLAELAPGTAIAGVFTGSLTRAAPVLDCEAKLGSSTAEGAAFLVNAGNANAFTGQHGEASVAALVGAVSDTLQIPAERVFSASTGVIGEPLPHEIILQNLSALKSGLATGRLSEAAEAIRTTDTFAKGATATLDTPTGPVQIAGIAKGSGMIAPDMATMLAFVFTDAAIDQPNLQAMLARQVHTTFNAVTVDSDTSTSDTVLVAATGQGPTPNLREFEAALGNVMRDLAHQIVRDGEGATKFVEVQVTGARDPEDAKRAAMAIANSPLVKTAIAGEDPNWGRIVMAVGKSGAAADRDKLSIWFGDILVAENGWVAESYAEDAGAAYMKASELVVRVDLGMGQGRFTAWTCDLTHGYISINADYRS